MNDKHGRDYHSRYVERKGLKTRMRSGETLLGSFVFLSHPSIIEILAEAGLDFFIIDLEHSPKSWDVVENMIRAAEVYGLPALIRVPENKPEAILHALEVGAAGIAVPFVETATDVRRSIDALRYFPDGMRGTCTQTRAARHGVFRSDFVEYAASRNEELVLMGLIENQAGVANIDEILAVPDGLDCLLLGRADLASVLGKPGQSGDPVVVQACDQVLAAVQRAKAKPSSDIATAAALAVYGPSDVARWAARGCSVFVAPSDSSMFVDAASAWRKDIAAAANGS